MCFVSTRRTVSLNCAECSLWGLIHPSHNELNNVIKCIVPRLVSSKWYHKDTELQAMDWLEDQFTCRAANQWHLVAREASRTATTLGIGPNSILYHSLHDMITTYPAHDVKAAILRHSTVDLVWAPGPTKPPWRSTLSSWRTMRRTTGPWCFWRWRTGSTAPSVEPLIRVRGESSACRMLLPQGWMRKQESEW